MPLDFENNFIQPLLLDIQNGNIPDASTYCAKVGEYYEKTISAKEGKIIIPQTLVSPTLTSINLGVPVTVPISQGQDAYLQPNSYRSQLRMYRTLARYYVNKELVSGQQDLEQSLSTLESIVRKQSFNTQRLKTYIASARNIKTQIVQLPSTIKDVIIVLLDEVAEHRSEINRIITELTSEEFKQKLIAAGLGAPAQIFAEEFAVYDAVKNINFKNISSLPTAIASLISYTERYKSQNSLLLENAITTNILSKGQNSEFLKTTKQKDITERIKRIIKIAEGIIAPTTLGPLLATINPKTPEKESKLKKAIKSYEQFKQAHELLRPQLINLERIITQEKQQVKAYLKRKIEDIKDVISKKMREMAEKRAQKRALRPRRQVPKSPKKQLLKQAIDDVKIFRANNEENFRIAKTKMQLSNKILRDSLGLITKTKALRDGIIKIEIPKLLDKLKKAKTDILDLSDSLKKAGPQASASYAQVATKLSTSFSGNAGSDRVAVLKELGSQAAKYAHATSDKQFIQTYFQEQGLQDIAAPFILIAASTSASYQDYRVFMEQKQQVYEEYYRSILSLEVDYKKIEDNVRRLNDEKIGFINPVDMTTDAYKQRRAEYINRQLRRDAKKRARLLESQQKPPAKWSLTSILKAIFKFLRKIALVVVEIGKKLKVWIEKQKVKALKFAEKVKIATIASIPTPNYKSDGKTKAEVANEKIAILKHYQAQLRTGKAKAIAIALATQAGSNLVINLSQNKLRASENEKWLNQLADAKYKFEIINVSPDDAKYKKAAADKQILIENVTSLYIIEKYIDILSLVFKAVKNSRRIKNKFMRENVEGKAQKYAEGFIEDLKQAALMIGKKVGGKTLNGTPQIIADLASNQLVSAVIDLFSAENDFASILSKLKTIFRQLNGNVLSSLLKSVDFTQALIDVEQKYLKDVQIAIQKIVGTLNATFAETEELEEAKSNILKQIAKIDEQITDKNQLVLSGAILPTEEQYLAFIQDMQAQKSALQLKMITLTAGVPVAKDARRIAEVEKAVKLKAQKKIKQAQDRLKNFNIGSFNFYNEMKKLDNTITKQKGSFIIALMDRLIWQINYFESVIRKQVVEWLKKKKDELKVLAKKQLAQHEEKFAKVKQKLANIDSAAMSAILGLSARSFWMGATWQNKQGTTFQVYTIGRFPKLKKNGLVDGSEALVREIAENFQKQLNSARGQAFPQPSYGLPPITFTGYGT